MKFMIRCDRRDVDFLKREIDRIGVEERKTGEVKGLGGEIVELVIAGTVALNATAALLKVIAESINLGKAIRAVKIGDKEITNPTKDQIEKLTREFEGEAGG